MNKLFFLVCLAVAVYASGIFGTAGQDNGDATPPLLNDMQLNYQITRKQGNIELHDKEVFVFSKKKGAAFACQKKIASDSVGLHVADSFDVNQYFAPIGEKYTILVEGYPIWLPVDKLANDDIAGHKVETVRWNNKNAYKVVAKNRTGAAVRYFSTDDGIFLGSTRKTKKTTEKIVLLRRT